MANPAARKGARWERAAVTMLATAAPHLLDVPDARRMLGAGRKDDVGDLRVFSDVAIQVRAYKSANLGTALRSAAVDALRQAGNAHVPHHLGLVPLIGARTGAVAWVATALTWPVDVPAQADFALVSRALAWVRSDQAPHGYLAHPRSSRVGTLAGSAGPTVLLAPVEAWLAAYEQARGASGLAAVA